MIDFLSALTMIYKKIIAPITSLFAWGRLIFECWGFRKIMFLKQKDHCFAYMGSQKTSCLKKMKCSFAYLGPRHCVCMYLFFCIITLIKAILLYFQSSNLFEVSCIHLGTCILQRSPGLEWSDVASPLNYQLASWLGVMKPLLVTLCVIRKTICNKHITLRFTESL